MSAPSPDPTDVPTRRAFLRALGATAGAAIGSAIGSAAIPSPLLAALAPRPAASGATGAMQLGVQLYTVRDALARDFEGTLAALAAIGYRNVELFSHHGRSPAELRAALDRHGLAAPSAHVALDELRASPARALDAAATLRHQWVVIPWVAQQERTADGWRGLAAEASRWGEAARARGLGLAYHNHDFAFAPLAGVPAGAAATGWDILRAEADPALVKFELDVYWAIKAGRDPIELMTRDPGRVVMLHAKDATGAPERGMVDVGAGTIDFARLLREGARTGVQAVFVEHDEPADALATARAGYAHLRPLLP